jgi:hypothetical protein
MQNLRRSTSSRELLGCLAARSAKEMSAKRKHRPNWDDGFFMARADQEWRPAPRLESEPLKIRSKRFNFEACRTAWLTIGLIQSEGHVRAHMERLKAWEKRLKK